MHLDPRAIELPLDRHVTAKLIERLVHVIGRLRQHRLDGLKELDTETSQARFAGNECRPGDWRKRAGHHHRPPDGGGADVCCPGDCIDEDRFECPLPQLACQQSDDEVLFRACGLPQEFAKPLVARAGRVRRL